MPVPTDEAVREAESRLLGVETNITNWQRKQNQNNNFSATVPYDIIPNFFTDNYDHPIFECGVKLVDMVIFQRNL